VGAWPWFVFLGVGLLSRAQEPTILRADSIFLFHQAQWVATWLLLGLHLAVGVGKETRLGVTAARASSLVLLLGAVQWLTTCVLDAALPGPPDFQVATRAAGSFLMPALPLSIVSMKQVSDQSTPESLLRLAVIAASVCLALASWRLPAQVLASCSAILMVAAAAVVQACLAPSPSQPLDEN